jgi:hypothetical protein
MISDALQLREHVLDIPVSLPAIQEVTLRHLEDPASNGAVQRLRQEIDLAVHARLNPHFHLEEKKETKSEFPSPSSGMVN